MARGGAEWEREVLTLGRAGPAGVWLAERRQELLVGSAVRTGVEPREENEELLV